MAAILVVLSERNIKILYRISQTSFLQSKQFVVPQRRRFYFLISANQKKKLLIATMSLSNQHASWKIVIYLAKQFQIRSFFRNRPIRNKNCLWQPCF